MTLVLDRPGPGARVHVLAIGVGGYRHLKGGTAPVNHPTLKLGQLSGPSHSTHAFVDWVVNRMHHPTIEVATVELLASVAVGEDSPSDMPPVELPTRSNVEAAFLRWFDRCDTDAANVALFYFCGHGVQKGPNYLLLEDFGASRLDLLQNSVDITATYQGMARCRANSQYFFVDACREVPVELLQMLQGSPAVLVAPEAVGDDRESALLMATSGGHRAYGKARQATQFTEALIRALDGLGARFDGGRWVIDYLGLQRATTTLLRGDGMSPRSQRPQSYGAAGDEILHVCDGPPVVPVSVRCDPVEALAEPAATAALRNSAGGSDHSLRANAKGWSGEVAAGSYDLCIDFPAGRYVSYRSSVLALPPGLEWPPVRVLP